MRERLPVFIGMDTREPRARQVAEASLLHHAKHPMEVRALDLVWLRAAGLFDRPIYAEDGSLKDVITGRHLSTEHALTRFLVPHLWPWGWSLFCDGDVMFRADVAEMFAQADDSYAAMVVPHSVYEPPEKRFGDPNEPHARKNWSSVVLWNGAHRLNRGLKEQVANAVVVDDHFRDLQDAGALGYLSSEWNHLVGIHPHNPAAKLAHFTLGTPDLPGYEAQPFADEWRSYLGGAPC